MIRKILLAMISGVMLCACGGGAKTDAPESTAKEMSLVGDWKEDTDNSSYFYAIIAGNTKVKTETEYNAYRAER